MARIRYDVTPVSVIVYCDCGWRELELDRDAARRLAAQHEANVHPESRQVYWAQRVREARRHVELRDVHNAEDDGPHGG